MRFHNVDPSRARPASSMHVSILFTILTSSFSNIRSTYALNADTVMPGDHNHPLIQYPESGIQTDASADPINPGFSKPSYEPEFSSMSRSMIGRTDAQAPLTLQNNQPGVMSIMPGDTQCWMFPRSALGDRSSPATSRIPSSDDLVDFDRMSEEMESRLIGSELKKRQGGDHSLYLTLSVCGQPSATVNNPSGPPPPLELYISQISGDQCPGPNFTGQQGWEPADGGFANYTDTTSGDSYFGVFAPTSSGFSGSYDYEITASIETPYTYYQDFQSLYYLDSDQNSSLLMTTNLTTSNTSISQWMQSGSPFSVFLHPQEDVMITGLLRSYCGLNNSAAIRTMNDIEVGMTTVAGGLPKQQYYVDGLNKSTAYYAVMALESNFSQSGSGNPGGGGTVWQDISFDTKADDNCQLIYNLTFCDDVSYAVPSNANNPTYSNMGALAAFYDNYSAAVYQNFTYSLEQIPCQTTPESQYSLATNCDNCAAAYKQWLCAVTIPRCVDYTSTEPYLQARNVAGNFTNGTMPSTEFGDLTFSAANQSVWFLNSSRVPAIDTTIQPGPYKEILPCIGLCYGIVQNCPASLGFTCPLAGKGQNHSYGYATGGNLTCNIPGAIWGISDASGTRPRSTTMWTVLSIAVVLSAGLVS